jgi:hypothetical protein
VYQLQSVVVQKAVEEISRWEVEAVLKEGTKDDLLLDVLAREISTSRQAHSKPNEASLKQVPDPKRASQFS